MSLCRRISALKHAAKAVKFNEDPYFFAALYAALYEAEQHHTLKTSQDISRPRVRRLED